MAAVETINAAEVDQTRKEICELFSTTDDMKLAREAGVVMQNLFDAANAKHQEMKESIKGAHADATRPCGGGVALRRCGG